MSATAKESKSKATPTRQPRFPKDPTTIRRVHHAAHDFAEQLRGDLEQAVRDARSRQLAAARHVEHLLRFLLHRQSTRQPKLASSLEAVPTGIVISADLAIGLKHVDWVTLAERAAAWSEAAAALVSFEGKRFNRKPLAIGKGKEISRKVRATEPEAEAENLAALEREAVLLLEIFHDVAAAIDHERRLALLISACKSSGV